VQHGKSKDLQLTGGDVGAKPVQIRAGGARAANVASLR